MAATQQPDIGHYRITSKLGEGGMGEVWRATDTRLNREVAIKVLPAAVAGDAMRMARFTREAQVLASLNHPGIASIYGVEEGALVMELVEGPTLAERIARGAVPLEEALPIAIQIAEALEYAHEKGVIHRDLKPANIKVTPEGRAKVLDFGLAKAMTSDASASAAAEAPTLTTPATLAGTILGTAAYMAPEQARGQNVDRRADIWAFGVVLYEMLTGERPFGGPTISDTLAAMLRAEPDLDKTPPALRPVIEGCLRKDPRQRCQCIGDVRLALGAGPLAAVPATPVVPGRSLRSKRLLLGAAAIVAMVAAGALIFAGWRLRAPTPPPVVQFTVAMPADETLAPNTGGLAIAPDGSMIAFTAIDAGGIRRIFLRRLDQAEAFPVPGSDGATRLFFSPDSQWIAFSAHSALLRAPVSGGTPIQICEPCSSQGLGIWGGDGMIYFNEAGKFQRVAASGGTPSTIATTQTPHWSATLPGLHSLVYSFGGSADGSGDDSGIAVQSLPAGKGKVLMQGGTDPHYLAGGYLVYAEGGRLLAAPFDQKRQELTGEAFPVMEDVWQGTGGYSAYAIARDGSMAYVNGGESRATGASHTAEWVDRTGVGHPVSAGAFEWPQLSPDGKRVAFGVTPRNEADIWTLDLAHGTLTRLTFATSGRGDGYAVWTPDGKKLIYGIYGGGAFTLAERAADGSGTEQTLFVSSRFMAPQCVTPDGKSLLFFWVQHTYPELWRLPLTGGGKPEPVIQSGFATFEAQLSPDGRWLAYASNEDGPAQVFVRPYPSLAGKWQISVTGGQEPRWSADGRQLFYRTGDRMMAVAVDGQTGFSYGSPRLLFDQPFVQAATQGVMADYAVAADGRFLMLKPNAAPSSAPAEELHVVLNWEQEVKRLARH